MSRLAGQPAAICAARRDAAPRRSDRPRDMTLYQMPLFGRQIVGLLECAIAFTPLLATLTFGERFLDECWAPRAAGVAPHPARVA
jgi:hypothetical protein